MNAPVRYGQTGSEKQALENEECRRIVKELENYGLTQRQMLVVIYLMAQELENVDQMRSITKLVRKLATDLFVSGTPEEKTEEDDGSSDIQQ